VLFLGTILYRPAATGGPSETDPPGEPTYEQVIRIALASEPRTLDPHAPAEPGSRIIADLLFDRLVYTDEDGRVHPSLAESWAFSRGGNTLRFTLRGGIRFHDGTPVDADAVVYTFRRLMDRWPEDDWRVLLGPLEGLEAPDVYTVVMHFSRPHPEILFRLASPLAGILSPAGTRDRGDGLPGPTGSGPMRLAGPFPSNPIRLVPHADHAVPRGDPRSPALPPLDAVELVPLPDADARREALERGIVHAIPTHAPTELADAFDLVQQPLGHNLTFVGFDHTRAPFDDIHMRRAVAHAINRTALLERVLDGNGVANYTPLPVGAWGHDPALAEHAPDYDLTAARAAIADAGYLPAPGGGWENERGESLALKFWVHSTPATIQAGRVLREQLEAVGMTVDMQVMEPATLRARRDEADTYHLKLTRWTWPDNSLLSVLFFSPGWAGRYSHAGVDDVLRALDAATDIERRHLLGVEAGRRLMDDIAMVPLYTDGSTYAHRPELRDLRIDTRGLLRLGEAVLLGPPESDEKAGNRTP